MNDELSSILRHVRSLYRKYGIRSVTMDDVAHELGISKKTLYQYVRDKDELVNMVVDLELSTHHTKLLSSCRDDLNAIEELAEIALCINYMLKEYSAVTEYDLKKYYPELYTKLRDIRRERISIFIHDNLKKGKQEGLYRDDLNVDILSKISISYIDSMFENQIITITEFLEPRFFLEYFIYHLRGIVNEKGLRILVEQVKKLEK